ncbi:sensor histidine kinase [Microbacterium terricola]|uniref:Sensor-like histidine kinase SenX3 n=1 Tax=Microbacterium terricola TaxID=344163 RepID=A0ABM8E068_9MICO|nr:ATP-binding protein [Microbacterium terricola]UYK40922.1 ATP-binding protein [Microbacterium terricola]BDV31328.1 two-component sensor histidine kinase [Microbacterium terricola]
MDTVQLALLALLLGVAIGGSVTAIIVAALRTRDRARTVTSVAIPEGVLDVLHGLDDPAAVVDSSSTAVAASDAARVFGIREGEAIVEPALRTLARQVRDAGTTATVTLRLRRAGRTAEPRLVSVRATRITPRLSLLVLRDITEHERVEQMRRDFVANTSHELKTPVGAVSLLAEAIESAADDPDQVRIFTARLSAEAARLGLLSSRIMDLSRLQSADQLISQRTVAVDEVVVSALEAHAIQADAAGVDVVRGGQRGLHVQGDPQVLSEAVGNLVANAIVYSPKGASVGVGVKEVEGAVEIAVTDRGIGIPEADQERVFERFYRTDQARSRRTGGTGLGLSIVKHAVQRHGGDVRVWSQPGQGSTFTIRLPISGPPEELTPGGRKERKPKKKKKKRAPAVRMNGEPA